MGGSGMPGAKGRNGGRCVGTASKKKAYLLGLHGLIDERAGDADWNSITGALVKKAKRCDVRAFRELCACRFGQIPVASRENLNEDETPLRIRTISFVDPVPRKDGDQEPDQLDDQPSDEPALQSEDE
jgi:hypothetical protein